jgi:hypothetical protein
MPRGVTVTDWDRAHEILRREYRRRVLSHLLAIDRSGGSLQVPGDVLVDGEDPTIVRTTLFHRDLPKLEDAGFIRWDRTTGRVRPGPAFDAIRPFVELVRDNRSSLPDEWVVPGAEPWGSDER